MSEARDLRRCRTLLPAVSRTFSLAIRILPPALRDPVTIAYLLCRLADLVEDATEADPRLRVRCLEAFAAALGGEGNLSASLDAARHMDLSERGAVELFSDRAIVFRAFGALSADERAILGRWIQAMALGMASFVARELRPGAGGARVPYVLETREELRSYAYYVAGTVGHLLTDLFELHLGEGVRPVSGRLRELAAPFGLGLQFTNILQDLAEDRRRGWSYLPEDLARAHGAEAATLEDPERRDAALAVIGELVSEAAGYLDQAIEFTLLLPRSAPRVRLFCLWPIFFALRTLTAIHGDERVLAGKIRISRSEVRRLMGETGAACFSDSGLAWLYRRERSRLARRITARAAPPALRGYGASPP